MTSALVHIDVDFNNRAGGGLVKGSLRRATGPIEAGQVLVARDLAEDDMRWLVRVEQVDAPTERVLLRLLSEVVPPIKASAAGAPGIIVTESGFRARSQGQGRWDAPTTRRAPIFTR